MPELVIDGVDDTIFVREVQCHERIGVPFVLTLKTVWSDQPEPSTLSSLIGRRATWTAEVPWQGEVESIDLSATEIVLVLVPRVAALRHTQDYRVFVDESALEIVSTVLKEHGLEVEPRLQRTTPKRAQCVQHFESDVDFVTRLTQEEGISLLADGDSVLLLDAPSAFDPIEGEATLSYSDAEGAEAFGAVDHVYATSLERRVARESVTLRDFDVLHPRVDSGATSGNGALEHYEFRSGALDPKTSAALASLRLQEAQSRSLVLRAKTTCRRLRAGHTFQLEGAPRQDMNRSWLVVGLEIVIDPNRSDGSRYEATFEAVPADKPFRPERTLRVEARGVETATVTGPAGSEIHTDEHGRSKLLHRWDRRRAADDKSSAWARSVQPALAGGLHLPRMGWEVLVGFEGTSLDEPYEIGRLFTGVAPPPESLPASKIKSSFGSATSPGGGGQNLIRMDDSAGSEDMTIVASADYREKTGNDKVTGITGSDVHTIGATHDFIVGIAMGTKVAGAQSYAVGGSRELNTTGAFAAKSASDSFSTGASRLMEIAGNHETHVSGALLRTVGGAKMDTAVIEVNHHVTGASALHVGGSFIEIGGASSAVGVLGAAKQGIGGPMNINASKFGLQATLLSERYATLTMNGAKRLDGFTTGKYATKGAMMIKGSVVAFSAKAKLVIKSSGVTITMTPGQIEISGAFSASGAGLIDSDEKNG